MVNVTCVLKYYNSKEVICNYKLVDKAGMSKIITTSELKDLLSTGKIEVDNLKLSKNGRIIASKDINQIGIEYLNESIQANDDKDVKFIKSVAGKLKLLGFKPNIIELRLCKNERVTIISKSETDHILYIPDHIKEFKNKLTSTNLCDLLMKLKGNLRVIGGKSIESTMGMFKYCTFDSVDLSGFCPEHLKYMYEMFLSAHINALNFGNLNTSEVISMDSTFKQAHIDTLDLSRLNTCSLVYASQMFREFKSKSLNLANFNTSKVTNMGLMFMGCVTPEIDLSSFDTSNVTYMDSMFSNCITKKINLSSFNTSKVEVMSHMFHASKVKSMIDLSNFDTHNVKTMLCMFKACKAPDLKINFDLSSCESLSSMFCVAEFEHKIDLSCLSYKPAVNILSPRALENIFIGLKANVILNDTILELLLNKRGEEAMEQLRAKGVPVNYYYNPFV